MGLVVLEIKLRDALRWLSQSYPIHLQRRAAGVLNSGECADPTTPLVFID